MAEISKSWKVIQKIGIILAILASLATLIGIYIQFFHKKTPEIELQVLNVEELSKSLNIEGFESHFIYKGDTVQKLWNIRFKLINSGQVTIISNGPSSNTLSEKIILEFEKESKIVNYNIEKNNSSILLSKLDSTDLSISFDQWRPNESVVFSVYVKALTTEYDLKFPKFQKRYLIDGDVNVVDYSKVQPQTLKPIIDYSSNIVSNCIRYLLSAISCIAILLILFFVFGKNIRKLLIHKKWFKTNHVIYENFLNDLIKQRPYIKEKIKDASNKPWKLDIELWRDFPGHKYPFDEEPYYLDRQSIQEDVIYGLLFITLSLLIISVSIRI